MLKLNSFKNAESNFWAGSSKSIVQKGFTLRHGRGSRVVVEKEDVEPFVVPLHAELKKGTLNHIIKQSGDFKEEFFNKYF
jgi:predicted RNA binding protein YcfA (HicA-like mRNA interferase family)